jgi:DNA polymerase III sliding clamp (beta) subunit (PCNA family)
MIRLKTYDSGKKLIFVGTDSFRLAEYKLPVQTDQEDTSMIVPKMNIGDIKRVVELLSSKGMKTFECQASDNLAAFRGHVDGITVLMTSLLIQGNFPEYENENIMPTQFKSKIMMSKDACDKAIKKIGILTRDINNYVQMSMGDQLVTVQS